MLLLKNYLPTYFEKKDVEESLVYKIIYIKIYLFIYLFFQITHTVSSTNFLL